MQPLLCFLTNGTHMYYLQISIRVPMENILKRSINKGAGIKLY